MFAKSAKLGRIACSTVLLALLVCARPVAADASLGQIRVVNRDGRPMAGERVFLSYRTPGGDTKRLEDGRLSVDGTFEITLPQPGASVAQYVVCVGDRKFEAGRFSPESLSAGVPVEIMLPPRAGDEAPDIAFVDLFTGREKRLSDYRGQVVLLDFWAAWCAPCQEAMKTNHEILSRRKREWAGKAVILALNIDDDIEDGRRRIRERDWTNLDNVFSAAGDQTGWNSLAPRVYGVDGIPTALLIDENGVIQWRGNPNSLDIERAIDDLLP